MKRFNEGLEAMVDGESISSDPLGMWSRRAAGLTNEVLEKLIVYVKEGVKQVEDPWISLRRAVEKAMELAQPVEGLGSKPGKASLRDLA